MKQGWPKNIFYLMRKTASPKTMQIEDRPKPFIFQRVQLTPLHARLRTCTGIKTIISKSTRNFKLVLQKQVFPPSNANHLWMKRNFQQSISWTLDVPAFLYGNIQLVLGFGPLQSSMPHLCVELQPISLLLQFWVFSNMNSS